MVQFDDRTVMGGDKTVFPATRWTQIIDSHTSNKDRENLIISELLEKYWKPVYCYLRQKGYSNDKSKDLTQGFFQEVVLGRELIQNADKAKGKFRTFLLTALDRYVIDLHRFETRDKRSPKGKMLLSLDNAEIFQTPAEIPDVTPEQGFHYAWISDVLDKVLAEVKEEFYSTGKQSHWEAFASRMLEPILNDAIPLSLPNICQKYGIDNESKASNMIITVKRRLSKALERHLTQFVPPDSDIKGELTELMKHFLPK
jgi:DNA-directed RNA polymerase specialized sigma24 family protein